MTVLDSSNDLDTIKSRRANFWQTAGDVSEAQEAGHHRGTAGKYTANMGRSSACLPMLWLAVGD
jgi:hypothetical protein